MNGDRKIYTRLIVPIALLFICMLFSTNVYAIENVPEYSGEPYVEINQNDPMFSEKMVSDAKNRTYESYKALDRLGRCGVCVASIDQYMMPKEKRGTIGSIKPTGWQTVKYSDRIDGNYLYNRCHLIGYQLTGENANRKNLITGTRYLNTEGMLPFENALEDYLYADKANKVLYRVTPVFEGNNLVASGVQLEALSLNDNGKEICFNVYCYNVQPGVVIDYETGDSNADPNYVVAPSTEKASEKKDSSVSNTEEKNKDETQKNDSEKNVAQESPAVCSYVLNTNTKKFHYPTCSSVNDMKPKNRQDVTMSRDEIIANNYIPCKRCKP